MPGKEKIVEVKFINQCPSSLRLRYGRVAATSLRASVNKREQSSIVTVSLSATGGSGRNSSPRLRLKDRDPVHTPDGTAGSLELGFTNATNPLALAA
jgi:hypothetical protein